MSRRNKVQSLEYNIVLYTSLYFCCVYGMTGGLLVANNTGQRKPMVLQAERESWTERSSAHGSNSSFCGENASLSQHDAVQAVHIILYSFICLGASSCPAQLQERKATQTQRGPCPLSTSTFQARACKLEPQYISSCISVWQLSYGHIQT